MADAVGLAAGQLLVKDEGRNPTGSFKARGLAVAVARARELGATRWRIPSAGNAGSAPRPPTPRRPASAAIVAMPRDAPRDRPRSRREAYGAQVILVDGLIDDCRPARPRAGPRRGWFDVSTLREPYRAEGKKTMGLELAEQLGWRLARTSSSIPTGGGTGIVGMWKAFAELEELG